MICIWAVDSLHIAPGTNEYIWNGRTDDAFTEAARFRGVASRGALGAVARFWQRTYAPDYIGLVLLIVWLLYGMTIIYTNALVSSKVSTDNRRTDYDIHGAISSHVHHYNINLKYPHALVERVPVCKTAHIRLELQR